MNFHSWPKPLHLMVIIVTIIFFMELAANYFLTWIAKMFSS